MTGRCPVDPLDPNRTAGDIRGVQAMVASTTAPGMWNADRGARDRSVGNKDGKHSYNPTWQLNTLRTHLVTMLSLDSTPTVELAVPNAVFGAPHPDLMRNLPNVTHWYDVRSYTAELDDTQRLPGLGTGPAQNDLDHPMGSETIIIAAASGIPPTPPATVQHALRTAHARGCRIVALGSGAFILAAAGVLAHRRATTHWSVVEELRRRHPDVLVESDVLYTRDEQIYTSAGGASTLDLCLELVRLDHGVTIANAVARWMIAPPHRDGRLAQRVTTPLTDEGDGIAHVLDWASARLGQPLALADLAQAAGVSPRTLTRRFHAMLGTTPLQWLLAQRIRLAQELLESTQYPVEQIAQLSGLGSPGNLRLQFTRTIGMSPHRYRREFRRRAAASSS